MVRSGLATTQGHLTERGKARLAILKRKFSPERMERAKIRGLLQKGQLGNPEKPKLQAALLKLFQEDKSFALISVRAEAADILGRLKDKEAVPFLIETMERDEQEYVQKNCANSLGKIGDKRAIPALLANIERLKEFPGSEVFTYSVRSLGELKATEAVPVLCELLPKVGFYYETNHAIQRALGDIGDKRAYPALIKSLNSEDFRYAAYALGELRMPEAIPELHNALKRTSRFDPNTADVILDALKKLGDKTRLYDLI